MTKPINSKKIMKSSHAVPHGKSLIERIEMQMDKRRKAMRDLIVEHGSAVRESYPYAIQKGRYEGMAGCLAILRSSSLEHEFERSNEKARYLVIVTVSLRRDVAGGDSSESLTYPISLGDDDCGKLGEISPRCSICIRSSGNPSARTELGVLKCTRTHQYMGNEPTQSHRRWLVGKSAYGCKVALAVVISYVTGNRCPKILVVHDKNGMRDYYRKPNTTTYVYQAEPEAKEDDG